MIDMSRTQAMDIVRIEKATNDFLRQQNAELGDKIKKLESDLAEANRVIEQKGAANMQLCKEYGQLRHELEAIGAGGVEMMGSRR